MTVTSERGEKKGISKLWPTCPDNFLILLVAVPSFPTTLSLRIFYTMPFIPQWVPQCNRPHSQDTKFCTRVYLFSLRLIFFAVDFLFFFCMPLAYVCTWFHHTRAKGRATQNICVYLTVATKIKSCFNHRFIAYWLFPIYEYL